MKLSSAGGQTPSKERHVLVIVLNSRMPHHLHPTPYSPMYFACEILLMHCACKKALRVENG